MSFRETIEIYCDRCEEPYRAARRRIARFSSHSAAIRTLAENHWYVDAFVVYCPDCNHRRLNQPRRSKDF